jgi:hypothetical protein
MFDSLRVTIAWEYSGGAMKTILFLEHVDQGQKSLHQCALDLTRAVGRHLDCLDVTQIPVFGQEYVPTVGDM